jgi:hypothetical protein
MKHEWHRWEAHIIFIGKYNVTDQSKNVLIVFYLWAGMNFCDCMFTRGESGSVVG